MPKKLYRANSNAAILGPDADRFSESARSIPVSFAAATAAAAVTRRRRPPLTTRAVIAAFSVVCVLVVGVTTFTVSYTSTLSTIDDIGRRLASAIVAAGQNDVEGFFDRASRNIKAVAKAGRQSWNVLPRNDPTDTGVLRRMSDLLMHVLLSDVDQLEVTSCIWDDGSVAGVYRGFRPDVINLHSTNARTIPPGQRCCGAGFSDEVYLGNMSQPVTRQAPIFPFASGEFDGYDAMKSLVQFATFGMWISTGVYENFNTGSRTFMLQLVHPIQNQTGGYIALLGFGIVVERLGTMVRELDATPNSQVFILDSVPAILATTHEANFSTFTPSTERNPRLDPGCATSAALADPGQTVFTIACRTRPADFGAYPPLQTLAQSQPRTLRLPANERLVTKFTAGGDTYYAAGAGLRNTERNFALTLLLIMPEEDILGDIITARNTVIGIVAAVCVTFAVIAVVIVSRVLAPLGEVSRRMRRTAQLKDESKDVEWSNLAEIHDLQDAYLTMHTAITSFTRYVPRDVVKDLMDSGQLCEIRMEPKTCAMLFVDIAGFTSMCERVPPQELSALVESYFERMSATVMRHDGLIDKFIGDCIMAVWGAPFESANIEMKAALAAISLGRESRVAPLATEFDEAGELLRIRVGVATGSVLAGNMGSAERMNYTVIGDPVNLASRLESLNKQFGTCVMLDEATAAAVSGVVQVRLLLAICVVGKEKAVRVYEAVGLRRDFAAGIDAAREADRRATDEAHRRAALDDCQSVASSHAMSDAGAATRSRAATDTAQMVDAIARLSDAPLVATDPQGRVAATHTAAVEAMMNGRFAAAIDMAREAAVLAEAASKAEPDAHWLANTVPLDKFVAFCEALLQDPPGPGFDGAWRSDAK